MTLNSLSLMSLNKHQFLRELFFPSDKIVLSVKCVCVYKELLLFNYDNTKLGKFSES